MHRLKSNKILVVLGIALVLLIGTVAVFYVKLKKLESGQNSSVNTQAEIGNVIEKVGRHILLPKGEVPTIATITNLEDLKGQPFFANAQIGYKVLIYTQAKKVMLYDPNKDILVEVAPLNISSQ